ncbi:protein WVD2-like 7 isoform X2 [Eutrema salsugineum]|uniref:protein WVD2-like 7 isoform X2 n=1 Tax=Eutrema salsugineum TaxID=72664 RepID=UPI000CED49A3|nr:protein WVD2-like 7 isoform X2 [Eutrema salsugineum]
MGESAVLFHSYSFAAPLSRNESPEDNPIHALSESVSFGRFMTENLEWGKWSSFSHKKYVDEAEKYSQPGSVAQKKAFFEAHYKKIAEAKKAKASDESSDSKQQQPESVAVLLNTLETLTKDEVKEEESGETDLVSTSEELVLSIEKDEEEEPERTNVVVVMEREDAVVDNSLAKQVIADDIQAVLEVLDEKESHTEDKELLKKKRCSVGEQEEERKSETRDKAMELVFSQKISEKPTTHNSSVKKIQKPVRPRYSFLNFLMGNNKTQDQNPKRKTDKKPNKPFLCLCFNPEMVGETEAPAKTQRRNL